MDVYSPKKNLPFRPIKEFNFPQEVQVQTHTACNGRCIMCPYPSTYKHVSHGIITWKLFKKIVNDCAEHSDIVKDFKPFLMNEPLIDDRLPDFIRYTRKRLPKVNIGFSTNGQLLEGERAEKLLDSGLNEIWVNLCGNTEKTYSAIMKGLSFYRVRQNIINFKNEIVRKGLEIKLFISVVETKPILTKLEEMIAFWQRYDIEVVTTPLNNRGGNVDAGDLRVLNEIRGRRVCDRPFYKIYIIYNGNVILCSSDWKREIIIGNVTEGGIYSIWHSKRQKEIRERLLAGNFFELPPCERCDYVAIYE